MTNYSEVRIEYRIEADKAKDEKQAFFTHFLQNHSNGVSEYFKNGALDYLDELIEKSVVEEPRIQYQLPLRWDVPFPPVENPSFTFIDLFAGIGGFRIAFQEQGGKCVFSSEWNKYAKRTYEANFGEVPFGDITEIDENEIPEHDVLLGGFPCQPFSIAGVSKKNSLGRNHGFLDETQGTLFYDIVRIIKAKRPKAFLLENVKNLRSHDKGKTYKIIKQALKELNYITFDEILDAKYYVPQHRERIFIAGFNRDYFNDSMRFEFPKPENKELPSIRNILDKKVSKKYTLTDKLWQYLQDYAEKHRMKGNGFGFGLTSRDGIARTLSARYYKDGSEILIPQKSKNPRRLTPSECKRLMGYPEAFNIKDIGVSDTQLYKQFGNSVAVPVVKVIAENVITAMKSEENENSSIKLVNSHMQDMEAMNV